MKISLWCELTRWPVDGVWPIDRGPEPGPCVSIEVNAHDCDEGQVRQMFAEALEKVLEDRREQVQRLEKRKAGT